MKKECLLHSSILENFTRFNVSRSYSEAHPLNVLVTLQLFVKIAFCCNSFFEYFIVKHFDSLCLSSLALTLSNFLGA